MSFGQVALGLASIALGLNSLNNGVKRLRGVEPRRSRYRPQLGAAPGAVSGRPFHSTGYKQVRAPNGSLVPMQMRSFEIRSLDERIQHLRRLVDAGKRDPQVFAFARRNLTRRCGDDWCIPEKDNLAEAKAIFGSIQAGRYGSPSSQQRAELETARNLFRQIRRRVRYTSDIAGVDTYQKPGHTLALGTADCDDFSSLTCASLQAVGIPCRFKVIRTKGAREWNHIYPQAGFPRHAPTKWVSMDSSVNMPFGWEAPARMVDASRVFRVG